MCVYTNDVSAKLLSYSWKIKMPIYVVPTFVVSTIAELPAYTSAGRCAGVREDNGVYVSNIFGWARIGDWIFPNVLPVFMEQSLNVSGAIAGDSALNVKGGAVFVGSVSVSGNLSVATPVTLLNTLRYNRQTFSNSDVTMSNKTSILAQTGTMTAPHIVTLPAVSASGSGNIIKIIDESGTVTGPKKIIVDASGADAINGDPSYNIIKKYGYVRLESDGISKWTIVGES